MALNAFASYQSQKESWALFLNESNLTCTRWSIRWSCSLANPRQRRSVRSIVGRSVGGLVVLAYLPGESFRSSSRPSPAVCPAAHLAEGGKEREDGRTGVKWVCVGRGRGGLGRFGGRRSEFIAGEGIAAFLHCSRGTHDVGLQLYWAGENEHGREAAEIDRDRKGNGRADEGNGVVNLDPPSYPPRFHFSAFET